ncbi:MAG: Hpt domain-containing protein [Minwuia sp.]|uniref:Hpt domain-containing protein n=1 Tax=Minwuia sp. TaxID=2493630 RepID=UPI003A864CC5
MADQFDQASFGALKQALGDQMVEMLLTKYLAQMKEKVAVLQSGIDARDMGVVRQQAHDLTSSSGSVGLGAIRDKASACEFAVKDGEEDKALEFAREIVAMAPETEAAIRAECPNIP